MKASFTFSGTPKQYIVMRCFRSYSSLIELKSMDIVLEGFLVSSFVQLKQTTRVLENKYGRCKLGVASLPQYAGHGDAVHFLF